MTPRELAAAIRKGHTMIGEGLAFMPSSLAGDNKIGCALCAAWLGAGKSVKDYWSERRNQTTAIQTFSSSLDISVELTQEISKRHCEGASKNRLAIADWLDTLDVAKPADAQTFERFMQTALVPVDIETVAAK